jgi:diguanylate cyclase (GGDEF)-like protein
LEPLTVPLEWFRVTTLAIHYSLGLVIVSVLISMGAAYAALSLVDRMRATTLWSRRLWLLGGSAAMGGGIWSMHYLGMLAVELPVPVYYFWPTVLLSLLMAIAASGVALMVASAEKSGWPRLLAGGALMGAGIGGMHYTGMAAMRSSAMEHYNLWVVGLSVVAAVGFSWMALWIAFAVRDREQRGAGLLRVAAGCVMGLGIASMHYIAMSGVSFTSDTMAFSLAGTVRVNVLGQVAIVTTVVLILVVALVTAALDKRRFHDLRKAHAELEAAQQALLESQEKLSGVNAMLSELSIRDGLTGLYNRRHFDTTLETEWRRAARKGRFISVLMIDVDCFKAMNDTYGHQRGDDCLREIARSLEEGPRRGYDLIARYGGEEFVVLLPEADGTAALKIAESIRRAIEDLKIVHEGSTVAEVVTVSIGATSRTPQILESLEGFVDEADAAMYVAKRTGKNRVKLAAEAAVKA